jgi:hypothetical protein
MENFNSGRIAFGRTQSNVPRWEHAWGSNCQVPISGIEIHFVEGLSRMEEKNG